MKLSRYLLSRATNALRMRFGVVVTDDDPLWGGEQGVGDYFLKRFQERSPVNDRFEAIHAVTGKLPDKQDIVNYDGFLFTGSHHTVNQNSQWVRNLEGFIRNTYQTSQEHGYPRMVGICFGHQLIAKALGGRVGPNPDRAYHFGSVDVSVDEAFFAHEFVNNVSFKKRRKAFITMMKFHGECVVERPRIAVPIGHSEQCEHEILMYGNTVLTTQGHPEYTKRAMVETNSKIMSRIGRFYPEQIRSKLDAIVEDDVENCTDMINAFLHHRPIIEIDEQDGNDSSQGEVLRSPHDFQQQQQQQQQQQRQQKKTFSAKHNLFRRIETIN